jgi:hypothetical protein
VYELCIGAKSVHAGYMPEKVVVSKIKKIPALTAEHSQFQTEKIIIQSCK